MVSRTLVHASRNLSIKEPSNRRIFAAQSPYHSITDGILPVRSNMEAAHRTERERRMVRKALGVCLGSILVVCVGIGCASALLPATSTAAPVANAASSVKKKLSASVRLNAKIMSIAER